ncbi:MAG: hypothetical protein IPL95_08265 [Saprospiraceae bacterium]|nr:hypothetical protein [Saprospiraceae bacterium]
MGTNQKIDSSFESNEVAVALKKDPVLKKYFGQQLAAVIHNRVQDAINLYFSGEEAELEKARYYNIFKMAMMHFHR